MVIATDLLDFWIDIIGVELLILEKELWAATRDPRVREAAALGWEPDDFRRIFAVRPGLVRRYRKPRPAPSTSTDAASGPKSADRPLLIRHDHPSG
ncbi:hypothetical protein [Streptomyces achromogenes]